MSNRVDGSLKSYRGPLGGGARRNDQDVVEKAEQAIGEVDVPAGDPTGTTVMGLYFEEAGNPVSFGSWQSANSGIINGSTPASFTFTRAGIYCFSCVMQLKNTAGSNARLVGNVLEKAAALIAGVSNESFFTGAQEPFVNISGMVTIQPIDLPATLHLSVGGTGTFGVTTLAGAPVYRRCTITRKGGL